MKDSTASAISIGVVVLIGAALWTLVPHRSVDGGIRKSFDGYSENDVARFGEKFGDPMANTCTNLIFGAYGTLEMLRHTEREAAAKDPSMAAMLNQVGPELLFKNRAVHDKIISAIDGTSLKGLTQVTSAEQINDIRSLTPAFQQALASESIDFYKKCEDIYRKIFTDCERVSSTSEALATCMNDAGEKSEAVKALYRGI